MHPSAFKTHVIAIYVKDVGEGVTSKYNLGCDNHGLLDESVLVVDLVKLILQQSVQHAIL